MNTFRFLIIILLFGFSNLKAQKQLYSGYLNGATLLQLELENENDFCHGKLILPKTKHTSILKGKIKNDSLFLIEYQNDQPIGRLNGSIKNQVIDLLWASNTNKMGGHILLKSGGIPSNMVQSVHLYKGTYHLQKIWITLQRNNLDLNGFLYLNDYKKRLKIQGNIDEEDKISLDITDESNGKYYGKIEGSIKKGNILAANLEKTNGEKHLLTCKSQEKLKVFQKTYFDFANGYTIRIPIFETPKINEALDQVLKPWLKDCKGKTELSANKGGRLQDMAYIWFDAGYFDDKIISFSFFYTNSWSNEVRTKVFNYDIEKQKIIEPQDILKERRFKNFLKNGVKPSYKYITYNPFGITIENKFNTIDGKKVKFFSYDKLGKAVQNKYVHHLFAEK